MPGAKVTENNANTTSNAEQSASAETQQSVGQLLRDARERGGSDVAEVARVLRISPRYLQALEDGRNQDLPGTAYAIGFVRSYAEHLKLDGEEVVRRYKAEAEGVGVKSDLIFPKPIPDSGVPGAAVLGLGVIVAAVAYGVWYWNSNGDTVSVARVDPVPEHLAAPVEPTASTPEKLAEHAVEPAAPVTEPASAEAIADDNASAVADETQAAVTDSAPAEEAAVQTQETVAEKVEAAVEQAETVTPEASQQVEAPVEPVVETPAEPVAEPVAEPAADPVVEAAEQAVEQPDAAPVATAPVDEGAPSRITVRAKSNSWIQIRDESLDRLLFTRLLREGDEYEVPNRPGLRLMTGNAGALELLVDGQVIPAIGALGEVRRNVEMDPDKLKAGAAVAD